MKTRREAVKTEQGSGDSLPTAQQRVMAQLKTAMLNLNKKHGTGMTTEMLSQILQTVNVDFGDEDKHKPVYSDVPVDSELASPPLPQVVETKQKVSPKKTKPFPAWFSFDEISKLEQVHFGPLFSMDEERWKVYLLTRNDVVRVAEEHTFIDPSMLRARMHPKDDAALVFEIWKFMTKNAVINRTEQQHNKVLEVAELGLNSVREVSPVPPQPVHAVSQYTPVNCASCQRECRFICYKPLPPPPQEETPDEDEEAKEEDVKMQDDNEEKLFCHDCTPPFFKKVPLRLFIDPDTRDRILKGEFEEVGSEDLKSFIVRRPPVLNDGAKKLSFEEPGDVAKMITKKVFLRGSGVLPSWDKYSVMGEANVVETKGSLEILDSTMQEALVGAGSKIRGSVLIEQQVRNIMYAANTEEEIVPTCSVSITRAFELVVLVLEHVAKTMGSNPSGGAIYLEAKKVDPVHAELVLLLHRICRSARTVRETLLGAIDTKRIRQCVEKRISAKKKFIETLKVAEDVHMAETAPKGWKGELFSTIKNKVPLASQSPKQLKLVYL